MFACPKGCSLPWVTDLLSVYAFRALGAQRVPELCMLIFMHAWNPTEQDDDRAVTAGGTRVLFVLRTPLMRRRSAHSQWCFSSVVPIWLVRFKQSSSFGSTLCYNRRRGRRVAVCIGWNRMDFLVVYQPLGRSGILHAHLRMLASHG